MARVPIPIVLGFFFVLFLVLSYHTWYLVPSILIPNLSILFKSLPLPIRHKLLKDKHKHMGTLLLPILLQGTKQIDLQLNTSHSGKILLDCAGLDQCQELSPCVKGFYSITHYWSFLWVNK